MSEKLAILGGPKVREREWPPYNTLDENEKREVMEVLDSGVLSAFVANSGPAFLGGPKVQKLEEAWAAYFGMKYAVSMNSATSALYAAVSACGIGPGDEVIVQPLTMSATATAAIVNGAVPVFADVDPHTMNFDPASVADRITPRTKAIYPAHLAGLPTEMAPLIELAEKHGLFLLEDNAQAPGALYKGQYAGTLSDIGVFSLNCHKVIQCGEGGVAVTNDDELALRLRLVRNHGEKVVRSLSDTRRRSLIGFNFRMTEMEAAVAYHQLRKLDKLNQWSVGLADHLSMRLREECDCITPPAVPEHMTHVYYFYHTEYDAQKGGVPLDLLAEAVQAEGVPVASRWPDPLYRLPLYQHRSAMGETGIPFRPPWYDGDVSYEDGICPEAEALADRSFFLERVVRWPNTEDDMEQVVRAVCKVLEGRQQLVEAGLMTEPDPA